MSERSTWWVQVVVLTCLVAGVMLPAFDPLKVPIHDALQGTLTFHHLLSSLGAHGEVPLWNALISYGRPANWDLLIVTPGGHLTALVGAAVGATDTLWWSKVSVAVDLWLFALGLLALGWQLYRQRWVALVVAALGVLSFSWYQSPFYSAGRMTALLPWVLERCFAFTRQHRARDLAAAVGLAFLSWAGNLPYHPGALALFLAVLATGCLVTGDWRPQVPSGWREAARPAAAAGLLLVVLAGTWAGALEEMAVVSPARDPKTGTVTLKHFLTYGGNADPKFLLETWLTGAQVQGDMTLYLGLGTLALAPLGVWVGGARAAAFGLAGLFALMVTFGGLTARAAWFFPGMQYFRHLLFLYPYARLCAWVCAGYALDEWRGEAPRATPGGGWGLWQLVGLGVLVEAALAASGTPAAKTVVFEPGLEVLRELEAWRPLGWRLLGYALLVGPWFLVGAEGRARGLPACLALALVADLASFQVAAAAAWPPRPAQEAEVLADLHRVKPLVRPARRVQAWRLMRSDPGLATFYTGSNLRQAYPGNIFPLVGLDPCAPPARTDLISAHVDQRLTEGRDLRSFRIGWRHGRLPADPDLWRDLACESARLRLRTRVQVEDGQVTSLGPEPDEVEAGDPPGEVRVLAQSWNGQDLQVDVRDPAGAWLVESEAHHPGWSATVDGQASPLLRYQGAFRALFLHPGTHQVRLRFFHGLRSVAALALVGLGALAGLGLIAWGLWPKD